MKITDFKYCSRAKHHVLRSEFGANITTHDCLQPWCKDCMREYRAQQKARKSAEYAKRNSWVSA